MEKEIPSNAVAGSALPSDPHTLRRAFREKRWDWLASLVVGLALMAITASMTGSTTASGFGYLVTNDGQAASNVTLMNHTAGLTVSDEYGRFRPLDTWVGDEVDVVAFAAGGYRIASLKLRRADSRSAWQTVVLPVSAAELEMLARPRATLQAAAPH